MLKKWFSRKLIAALGAAVAAAATGHYQEAAAIMIAYIAGQAYVDGKTAAS